MNISANNIKEYIDKYLNDVEDYGDDEESDKAKQVLEPINELILDSKQDFFSLLKETIKNSSNEDKGIWLDFLKYIKESQ